VNGVARPVCRPAGRERDLPLHARWLGRRDYLPVWRAMQSYTDRRTAASPDEIWLLEHPPVFTLGQAGRAEHVLAPGPIPVVHIDRGGQVTYHGPGQLVAYPLLDLKRLGLGIRQLVDRLEQSVIETLADFALAGERRPGMPGVYVAGAKIAALGLRVRRSRCFHGLAFNVAMDLAPYARIEPCGYRGLEVTDLARLGVAPLPDTRSVGRHWLAHFCRLLGYNSTSILNHQNETLP